MGIKLRDEANKAFRSDIQVLRGMALIAVVLFHAFPKLFPNGYLGVDLFFVISGFVVTPLIVRIFVDSSECTQNLHSRIFEFYKRRIFRLVPALLVALVVSGITLFFLGRIPDQDKLLKQGLSSILFLGNFGAFKFNSDYFAPNPNPLIHTWSLSVEMQFYLFMPLALFFFAMFAKRNQFKMNYFLSLLAISSILVFFFPEIEKFLAGSVDLQLIGWEFFSPFARAWEFLLGGMAALAPKSTSTDARSRKFGLGLFASLFFLFAVDISTNRQFSTVCVVLIGTLLIRKQYFYFTPNACMNKLEQVGDYSYSIYLFHLPLIYLANFGPFFVTTNLWLTLTKSCVAIFLSFLLGKFSHDFIEIRFRLPVDRAAKHTKSIQPVIWATISTFILFIVLIVGNNHFFLADRLSGVGKVNSMDWNQGCSWDTYLQPCILKVPGAKQNQLLIGDSMAASVSQVVYKVGAEHGMNTILYSNSSCPYIINRIAQFDITDDCEIHNANIPNMISKYNIERVVYVQSSPDWYFAKLEDRNKSLQMKLFNTEVVTNLDALQISNSSVIVFGFTPFIDDSYQSRAGYILGERLQYALETQNADIGWRAAVTKQSFNFIDTYGLICPLNSCLSKLENGWVLTDNLHLSTEGANLLKVPLQNVYASVS